MSGQHAAQLEPVARSWLGRGGKGRGEREWSALLHRPCAAKAGTGGEGRQAAAPEASQQVHTQGSMPATGPYNQRWDSLPVEYPPPTHTPTPRLTSA